LKSEVTIEAIDDSRIGKKIPINPIGNLTYTDRSKTDYYVHCMGLSLDLRLFADFGYDACVIVRDHGSFEDRLSKAVAKLVPDFIGGAGPITYVDPYNPGKGNARVSHSSEAPSQFVSAEYRCVWCPPKPPETPLSPLFVELDTLADTHELIILDIA
jgi:hypothetical protein